MEFDFRIKGISITSLEVYCYLDRYDLLPFDRLFTFSASLTINASFRFAMTGNRTKREAGSLYLNHKKTWMSSTLSVSLAHLNSCLELCVSAV